MIWLNGLQLPQPKKITRRVIEKGVEHLLVFGRTTKKTENRKEEFVLTFQYLTNAQANSIISLFNLETILSFYSTESNFLVAETDVLMSVSGREYPKSGEAYRENLVITLTEVR